MSVYSTHRSPREVNTGTLIQQTDYKYGIFDIYNCNIKLPRAPIVDGCTLLTFAVSESSYVKPEYIKGEPEPDSISTSKVPLTV